MKFVSTVILVLLVTALFLFVMCVWCGTAHAKREVSLSPDRTLIIKKVTVTAIDSIPNVPAALSKEVADSLVTGAIKKFIIKDEIGETISSFALPFIKSETKYRNKEVLYRNGWMTQDAPPSITVYDNYLLSVFWLWLPAIIVMVISMIGIVWRIHTKRILIFYATLFAAVLTSALVGGITISMEAGLIAGILIGGVAGAVTGGLVTVKPTANPAFRSKGVGIGAIIGMVTGTLASMLAGSLVGAQNFRIVGWYLLFLFGVEAISFVISFAYAEQQRARAGLKAEIASEILE